ncbi:fimbrial protein [Pseudomonas sp. W15Feb34]|jgi:type 1 fimbria pilin|uniref:fimbrial protein n=1 Tax=Pseudomonas sp. W15Feb34 TaxID=550727 RepID=UPI0020066C1E|nr:fimbrial protein [Pseudomonas sp. W15Feb34]MCK3843749.1 fimbrial protein [Pseudomonas sp. W15Feb34]
MIEFSSMNVGSTVLLVALTSCASTSPAAEQTLRIQGFVYAAIPCVINKNEPITQTFGDVQTTSIDGHYKTITLEYSLDCTRSLTYDLRMQVRGSDAGFDSTLLRVPGYENIGIALKKDGVPLAVNTWANFDSQKLPSLQAVLVKRKNSDVKSGPFRAGATLVVDYQ